MGVESGGRRREGAIPSLERAIDFLQPPEGLIIRELGGFTTPNLTGRPPGPPL